MCDLAPGMHQYGNLGKVPITGTGTNVSHMYRRAKMAIFNLGMYEYGLGTTRIHFRYFLVTGEGRNLKKPRLPECQ